MSCFLQAVASAPRLEPPRNHIPLAAAAVTVSPSAMVCGWRRPQPTIAVMPHSRAMIAAWQVRATLVGDHPRQAF